MDIWTYLILILSCWTCTEAQRPRSRLYVNSRSRPQLNSRANTRSRTNTRSRPQVNPRSRSQPSPRAKCFQRNLQYGRSFYHVMDEPIGKTTNILRGSGRIYSGKTNRDITFTIFGPSPYDGVRFKGFVVTRLCVFTKNVESIRMGVRGIPTKRGNGYTPAAVAHVQARVRKSNMWMKTCLSPYKTPLDQIMVAFRRRKGKPSRVQAQKLYMEACETR